jgi:hypothetical protein
MPSPILARADALMHRRRQGETGPLDDVPVLTDTVECEESTPLLSQEMHDQAYGLTLDGMAETLSRRIKQRLAAELPAIIDATVREFLADQASPKDHTPDN